MLTLSPAEVTQRIIDGDYRTADDYGIAWGDPLRTMDDVRAFTRWYLGSGSVLAVYGSRVTGKSLPLSDLDAVFFGCAEQAARDVIAWLYPGHRLDLVQSRTVWRPEYAPYAPLNWGDVDAQVLDISTREPSTLIRACVDGWCHSGTAHVPITEGDAETLGRRHVLRACEYARSRGWRVPIRVNPGTTLEIDGWRRAICDQRDAATTDRPAWAEGDSRGPYCGTRG